MSLTLAARRTTLAGCVSPEQADLADVVTAIGSGSFAARTLHYLNGIIGADYCAIYLVGTHRLEEIGSAVRTGAPSILPTETSPHELKRMLRQPGSSGPRIDILTLLAPGSRNAAGGIRDQILIWGRNGDAACCIRIVRASQEKPQFDLDVARLRLAADVLIALVAKHADLVAQRPNLTPALSSLAEIQDCIVASTDLSRREAEVCARALYGMTSLGIALDLGIGKESVMTYRKRAYHRLGIGSQRELLMWYLALWSDADRRTEVKEDVASGPWVLASPPSRDASQDLGAILGPYHRTAWKTRTAPRQVRYG